MLSRTRQGQQNFIHSHPSRLLNTAVFARTHLQSRHLEFRSRACIQAERHNCFMCHKAIFRDSPENVIPSGLPGPLQQAQRKRTFEAFWKAALMLRRTEYWSIRREDSGAKRDSRDSRSYPLSRKNSACVLVALEKLGLLYKGILFSGTSQSRFVSIDDDFQTKYKVLQSVRIHVS